MKNSSGIFWSSCNNSVSSTSCIFELKSLLFEKKTELSSKKVCYLPQMMDLDYWNISFFLFYTADCKSFFAFNEFSVRFLKYPFTRIIIAFRKALKHMTHDLPPIAFVSKEHVYLKLLKIFHQTYYNCQCFLS